MEDAGQGISLIASCIGLTIGIVIAAIVAQDANRRGMNGFLWGLGVFLLCIVFLPLYLIVRKPLVTAAPPPPKPGYALQQTRPAEGFCHHCGAALLPDARFCNNCGAERA